MLQEIIFYTVISSCIWWRLLPTNHIHKGVDLLPGLRVCSNNWPPLLPTLCAFLMCWKWKLPATGFAKSCAAEGRPFWFTAAPSYGDSPALDSATSFFPNKISCALQSLTAKVFLALVAAYCSALFQLFSEELWALMLNVICQYQSPQRWMCRWYYPLYFYLPSLLIQPKAFTVFLNTNP